MDDVRFIIRELEDERRRLADALRIMDNTTKYEPVVYDYVTCAYHNIGRIQTFISENLKEEE